MGKLYPKASLSILEVLPVHFFTCSTEQPNTLHWFVCDDIYGSLRYQGGMNRYFVFVAMVYNNYTRQFGVLILFYYPDTIKIFLINRVEM